LEQAKDRAWDSAQHDWNRSARNLRRLLTENQVSASDERAKFVGIQVTLTLAASYSATYSMLKTRDI
jgi:hypothetical protein